MYLCKNIAFKLNSQMASNLNKISADESVTQIVLFYQETHKNAQLLSFECIDTHTKHCTQRNSIGSNFFFKLLCVYRMQSETNWNFLPLCTNPHKSPVLLQRQTTKRKCNKLYGSFTYLIFNLNAYHHQHHQRCSTSTKGYPRQTEDTQTRATPA